jgi:hypothetical protein
VLQKRRVSSSFPVAVAQRRGGCGSRGRWDCCGSFVAAPRPPLPGIQVPSPCWCPAVPIDGRTGGFRGSGRHVNGTVDGRTAERRRVEERAAGLGSSSASARSRSSTRRIRHFATQEWLRRRLPCSAVTAPRPLLPELQAPSSYRCLAALIDGRAG